jgi:pimeloyl-ACP methyl ester carboxylesterase
MRLPALPLFLFLCTVSSTFAAAPASRALDQGEINGAKYAIVLPAQWNRQLILVAPPLRPENEALAAAFSPEDIAFKTLFAEGWMIAKTSFRRNGIIIADGLADLDALRAYVAQKYGQPERVLVTGESLGGLVAMLVAEREPRQPPLYDGVLAISPALQLRETPTTIGLALQPRIPILFLVNQGEIEGPKGYIASPFARDAAVAPPVIFRVSRGGRANLNQRERLEALRALSLWVERGPSALPRPPNNEPFFDATIVPEPRPSAVTMQSNGQGFDTHVTALASSQGNVLLDVQPADFAAAEIRPSTWFRMVVHDKTYRAFYGRDFDSVKRGEWVVVPGAEGNFILARHLGNAADSAKIAPGDTVTIQRFEQK